MYTEGYFARGLCTDQGRVASYVPFATFVSFKGSFVYIFARPEKLSVWNRYKVTDNRGI